MTTDTTASECESPKMQTALLDEPLDTLIPENPLQVTPPKRHQRTAGLIRLGGFAVFMILAYVAWQQFRGHSAASDEAAAELNSGQAVTITSGIVTERSVRRTVEVVGTLYGYEEVLISSSVEGRVDRLMVDVADRIEGGALLAKIDPTSFELNVRQAQRGLDVELARMGLDEVPSPSFDIADLPMVREARTRLNFATTTEERTRQLARSNAVAAQDLESAIADKQSAQAAFENQELMARAALATIKLREETLAVARQQLADTSIHAPTPEKEIPFLDDNRVYVVSSRSVSEGTFVRTGNEVFRLVIDNALRLRVEVPERHLGSIAVNQPAEISTTAYADPVRGVVSRINPVIEPSTRAFEVEILIDNSAHRLKPGGFAKASIITSQDDTAITIPLEALVTFAGITKVFLVEHGQSWEIQVVPGEQGADWIEVINSRLEPGSRVVTSGQTALADGTVVLERRFDSGIPVVSSPGTIPPSNGVKEAPDLLGEE